MIWLHAWYKQANAYPGPRCRDGVLLTEQRISKSDCDSTMDNRLNQVLLTNDHGDVFKRQINMDECDNIPYDQENIPSSPTESEYFEQHFVDYPTNENDPNRTYQKGPGFIGPDNRNRTLLNYNQYHLNQLQHNRNSSPFTFFGYPIPPLANLWGGEGRKSSSTRASADSNGRSRLRNFRPRPDEFIDDFQYSKGAPHFHEQNDTPPSKKVNNNVEFEQYRPNDYGIAVPPPPNITPNQVEKGGFVPMLPGYKGFTPIKNPYLDDDDDNNKKINEQPPDEKPDSSSNTDSLANESVHIKDDKNDELDATENKYPLRVSTIAPGDVRPLNTSASGNNLHLNRNLNSNPNSNPNLNSNINVIESTPNQVNQVKTKKEPQIPLVLPELIEHIPETIELQPSKPVSPIEKLPPPLPPTLPPPPQPQPRPLLVPTVFLPNGSDVINLSKNANKFDTNDRNQSASRNVLSALVAPGAQGIFRSGRPTITKVFTTTVTTPQDQQPPTLPFAEEYLRTTNDDARNNTVLPYDTTPLAITNNLVGDSATDKGDMDWYFNNYNKSKARGQPDLSLNRFRSSAAYTFLYNSNNSVVFLAIICILSLN